MSSTVIESWVKHGFPMGKRRVSSGLLRGVAARSSMDMKCAECRCSEVYFLPEAFARGVWARSEEEPGSTEGVLALLSKKYAAPCMGLKPF